MEIAGAYWTPLYLNHCISRDFRTAALNSWEIPFEIPVCLGNGLINAKVGDKYLGILKRNLSELFQSHKIFFFQRGKVKLAATEDASLSHDQVLLFTQMLCSLILGNSNQTSAFFLSFLLPGIIYILKVDLLCIMKNKRIDIFLRIYSSLTLYWKSLLRLNRRES